VIGDREKENITGLFIQYPASKILLMVLTRYQ